MSAAVLLLLASSTMLNACDKTGDLDAMCSVSVWLQETKGGELKPGASDTRIFVHYGADTTNWTVNNYNDARTGLLTNKTTGETRMPDEATGIDQNGNLGFGPVRSENIVLVAYNSRDCKEFTTDKLIIDARMFAFRELTVPAGLSEVRMSLIFRPWQEAKKEGDADEPVIDSKWIMRNDNPAIGLDMECELIPSALKTQGGQAEACASDVVVFVHYGIDPQQWAVSDYEDSKTGKLTNGNGDTRAPEVTIENGNSSGRFPFNATASYPAVIVVHNKNAYTELATVSLGVNSQMYAWRGFSPDKEAEEEQLRLPVTFLPLDKRSSYTDGEWTMKNDSPAVDLP